MFCMSWFTRVYFLAGSWGHVLFVIKMEPKAFPTLKLGNVYCKSELTSFGGQQHMPYFPTCLTPLQGLATS